MYWPPVSGIMLAISALVSAPNRVSTPASTQTPSSSSGEPTWLAMTPGLRKMPEPITPPTTIMIVVNRPSEGSNPAPTRWSAAVRGWFIDSWHVSQRAWTQNAEARECPGVSDLAWALRAWDLRQL